VDLPSPGPSDNNDSFGFVVKHEPYRVEFLPATFVDSIHSGRTLFGERTSAPRSKNTLWRRILSSDTSPAWSNWAFSSLAKQVVIYVRMVEPARSIDDSPH